MPDPHRRGTVSAENKEEADRLRKLWERSEAERTARGVGSQAAFGHEFDIGNQSAVGFFLNGQTALSLKAARGFALGLRVTIDKFSPRLAAQAAELGRLAGLTPDLQAHDKPAPPYLAVDSDRRAVDAVMQKLKTKSPLRRKEAASPMTIARRKKTPPTGSGR